MTEWPKIPFSDLVSDETGGNVKTLQSDYLASGPYPIVDQGQNLVGGYTDDPKRVCKADLPVIIFGDHTKCFKFIDFPFCLGADGTKVLRPKKPVNERYLFYALQRIHIPDAGYSRHFKYLKEGKIPLPPLEEQKRIAAILDQADALRRTRQRAINRLNTLAQSIFYEMFGNPQNWKFSKLLPLQQLAAFKGGGTPKKSIKEYYTGDIPWVTPKDMKTWDIWTSIDKITDEAIANSSTKLIPANSILIVNRSGILKHTLPIGINRVPVTINQDMKALICNEGIHADFLGGLLKALEPEVLEWVRATTADNFPIDNLKGVLVPKPDEDAQRKYANIVESIRDQINLFLKASSASIDLFASLQQRAFRGEL